MKKRLFALLSVLCLTVGMFGACGKSKTDYVLPTDGVTTGLDIYTLCNYC